jgi:two-component system cell cycle sensor histidine kinase/response regulator CckA
MSASSLPDTDSDQRIVNLVHSLRKIEEELQALTGGGVDAVLGVGGHPIFLRQAQEKLLQSENRYRSLTKATAQIVWTTNAEGLVSGDLPEWQAFTGQSTEEIAGYGCQRAIHPDDQKRTFEIWTSAVTSGKLYELEYRLRRHDGVYRDFAVRAVPVFTQEGIISEWVGCCTDITEQKQASLQLAANQALLRMASRISRLGAWRAEVPALNVTWSDETAAIHDEAAGYSPSVATAIEYYIPAYRETIRKAFQSCAQEGVPFDLEAQIISAKGRQIWIRAMGEAVRNKDDAIIQVQGAVQDITARKLADKKIQSQLHELERWREATLDREERVQSLKKEVNVALADSGKPPTYNESPSETCQIHPTEPAKEKNEESRLATLRSYGILDSPAEKDFDDLVTLAAHICGTPLAHISLVDKDRQWFKASFGTNITETPRDVSICSHAIGQTGLFVVPDASKDDRFSHNPVVTGDPRIRFYAGSPLTAPDGNSLGTLCVVDVEPRQLTEVQIQGLGVLSRHVMALIEVRQQTREMARSNAALLGMLEDERFDKTIIRQGEEQIAEQASFMDKAQDAIVVRNLLGEIQFWNKGAERMYGWQREDVLGRKMDAEFYADLAKVEEINSQVAAKGEWTGELQHFTKGQSEIVVEARMTLICDQQGNPKSILTIETDITEKKKIEAQFMRAQRMESIGTLAGGIAHDLNNILSPILMSIDLLKGQSDSPQKKQILKTIQVCAKRGADIVRQVLSFARGMEGERIEVQPKHLLNELENIIKDTFPKDIRLHFSVPNDIWTIIGDPTQVHQVLLNLSLNARDAMPNGGNLSVSAENSVLDEQYAAMHTQVKPGHYVKIKVTDSGTGIPPKLIEKIFEPFFTTKELSKGTGLGLSTVMAIVKSHGGIINVYSEPGKGTSFSIYVPAVEMSTEALKEQLDRVNMPKGNGETILIVDDEASILSITGQTLEAYGYRVLTATDGADALGIYVQHRDLIAVVLTDMMMPVMDGAAMVHALKRINPTIKIIAASGLNAEGEVNKATSGGIRHFLIKPYTAEVLLHTLRTIIDEK